MGQPSSTDFDVLIIGGGPAGATAARELALTGKRILVLEKTPFPRFHIGESFLPENMELIRSLGIEDRLRRIPHMLKLGAEFGMGDGLETTRFSFAQALDGGINDTFNIERAPFDKMLLDSARDAGAEVLENATVRNLIRLADGDVAIDVDGRTFTGRYLIDASGQGTVVGRHLGTRKVFAQHRKIAYFQHFRNVKRLLGEEEGNPTIVMCDEGWFWLIPLDFERTSIGLVMNADIAKGIDVPAAQMLAWGIARCPLVADRTASAVFPESNYVAADFSYACNPYAGPGYFLVGDSAVFLDPIFSTGVCLGMNSAIDAAGLIRKLLDKTIRPSAARRGYIRRVQTASGVFFKFINLFYQHAFRELFLHGQGPLQVHRAVISALAGQVFPKPRFAIRWRLRLFELIVRLHRRRSLVPNRASFSLLSSNVASNHSVSERRQG